MALVEINWNPNPRELRQFGISMIVGFSIFALVAERYWHRPRLAAIFLIVGAVAGVLGLTGRGIGMLVYRPWMAIAYVTGNIMSRVLVAGFFFLLITPMGLLTRLMGSDPLQRKNIRSSYWDDLPTTNDRATYERQF
jgi:hypothetical protein